MNYLLVTHIAFARDHDGSPVVDALWARDLKGTAAALGPITVAAPELPPGTDFLGWRCGVTRMNARDGIRFTGLPLQRGFDPGAAMRTRRILASEVNRADVVHTSNFFPPYLGLWYAHDLAVKQKKPTVFVVAEDFLDMLEWEWVRTAPSALARIRRRLMLNKLDREVLKRVASASLALLHTPAAVRRYRLSASNGIAIRQPVHEAADVIAIAALQDRADDVLSGTPLTVVTACRLKPLKGVDFLIRAISLLKSRNICVRGRIYGDGPEQPRLMALAERLGVANRIEFGGAVDPGGPLRRALEPGHLFAMPHLTTDFGRAFWDAMAAGLPVIAFRSPASEDTIRDQVDGLLTPNADFEGLADAIARLHGDREALVRAMFAARARALANTRSVWHQLRADLIRELVPA